MERKYFDQKIKDEAIQRFIKGESAGKIAKDMGIHSPDLIRKWVQAWRKLYNLSPLEYRDSDIAGDLGEVVRLRNLNQSLNEKIDVLRKALTFVVTGEIKGWEELKFTLRPPERE